MAKKKTTRKKTTSQSAKTAKKSTKKAAARTKKTTSVKKKKTTTPSARKSVKKKTATKKSSTSAKSPKKSTKKKTTKKTTAKVSKKVAKVAKKTASATKKTKNSTGKKTKKTPRQKKSSVQKNTAAGKTTNNSNPGIDKPLAMVDLSAEDHTNSGQDQLLTDEQMRKVKTGLTKRDLQYFRGLLAEKRAEITGDVASLDTTRADAISNGGSHMPLHMADIGTDSYEQDFMMGLMESEKKLLNEISEAMARIDNGTYGVCVVSGNPIAKARLEIQPWAKYCIEVARQRDS